jgi:hypothetical protein
MSIVNTMKVEVCDIPDAATVVAIEETVHRALSHLVGAWHVRLSANDRRGRWDFRVSGSFGHHVAKFLAAPHRVVEGVDRQLRSFLRGVVPPLSKASPTSKASVAPGRRVLAIEDVDGERTSRVA